MNENRKAASGEDLRRLVASFEDQLRQHRLESNRQQSLIGELSRSLKEAQKGLHQLPLVLGISAIVDRLDAYTGPDPDAADSVRDELLELLALHGVRPIRGDGPVDPSLHEVVRVEDRSDAEPGAVLEVWARGYLRGETVVRHAQVVVNRPRSRGDEEP
ncbi:nucleotide exchange factor GrpE [Glycomyces sp. L485]|uniref:nucleotide exchange factor GrpE n=1 Tax=Glycomyces sp. L485 TaxID=2909235 RepID=UPI001F4BB989|nr:nucleotide exchange factor GrpE [Glycomyces sp. L485]MCH7231048.1 nucleotide exchange factor GrpE [Glycomyces sp. L485]